MQKLRALTALIIIVTSFMPIQQQTHTCVPFAMELYPFVPPALSKFPFQTWRNRGANNPTLAPRRANAQCKSPPMSAEESGAAQRRMSPTQQPLPRADQFISMPSQHHQVTGPPTRVTVEWAVQGQTQHQGHARLATQEQRPGGGAPCLLGDVEKNATGS